MINKNISKVLTVFVCLLFLSTNTAFAIDGYSEMIEETSTIISLPENTVKGKVDFSIKGNTEIIDGKVVGSQVHNIKTLGKNLLKTDSVTLEDKVYHTKILETVTLKPNTSYVIAVKIKNGTARANMSVGSPDISKTFSVRDNNPRVFNTGSNTKFNFTCTNDVASDTPTVYEIMLIEGTTAPKEYTPYDEQIENIGVELHGINGINDEIVDNTVIRRIKKIVLDGSRTWAIQGSNTDYVSFNFTDSTSIGYSPLVSDKLKNISVSEWQNAISEGVTRGGSSFGITIAKSKLTTINVSGLKSWLQANPVSLLYVTKEAYHETQQLNIPSLIAQPNGTIIIDNSTNFAAMYNNGLTIENKDLPIEKVEKVYKIKDGRKTSIDLNKVNVTNGQGITINGSANGEIYEVSYRFSDKLTAAPTIRYSVPINLQGQINGNADIAENNNKLIQEIQNRLEILRKQMERITDEP